MIDIARQAAGKVLLVDARRTAEELGNPRAANSVLLGALSSQLDVPPDEWLAVIEARVPRRHMDVNRRAFLAGRERDWTI